MPKMKTKTGAKKRFRATASGKFKRGAVFKRHLLTKRSTKRKRHLRGVRYISDVQHHQIVALMPYA
jgi:large subunit ribosomal protein L35